MYTAKMAMAWRAPKITGENTYEPMYGEVARLGEAHKDNQFRLGDFDIVSWKNGALHGHRSMFLEGVSLYTRNFYNIFSIYIPTKILYNKEYKKYIGFNCLDAAYEDVVFYNSEGHISNTKQFDSCSEKLKQWLLEKGYDENRMDWAVDFLELNDKIRSELVYTVAFSKESEEVANKINAMLHLKGNIKPTKPIDFDDYDEF